MNEKEAWIVIPNWSLFQHYKDRDPIWIKDYVSQLNDDDWSGLTLGERGLLQTLRLMYAASDGRLTTTSALLRGGSHQGVNWKSALDSLVEAGLVELRASRPLSLARSREERREEKNDRASTKDENPSPETDTHDDTQRPDNGDLTTTDDTVKAEMLRLARGWLHDHGVAQPGHEPPWRPSDDEPF